MKLLLTILLLLSTNLFAASKLDEKNITKMLDSVKIAKEHENIKAMRKHFLSRTSVSITEQGIDDSDTIRLTFSEYTRFITKIWKKTTSNLIEIKNRQFNIEADGKSALVKTTLVQTLEIDGVKKSITVYETSGVKLVKGKIYINYYSARFMLDSEMKVN